MGDLFGFSPRVSKRLPAIAFLLVTGIALAGAEPLSLEAAVEQALRVNLDYQTTQLATDRARNSLSSGLNWKSVGVTATQKQTSEAASALGTSSLGLTLPLFDQLGASVSVDQAQNTQISLTATPLSHSDTAVQSRITYDKAVLAQNLARVTLETAVRKAYLAQLLAQSQLTVQQRKTALLETVYQDMKARYARAQITLSEVRTALQDWTQARSTQTSLERALEKARADLGTRLQSGAVELGPLELEALEALVSALGPLEPVVKGTSTAVKTQALEAEAQRAKADAVWLLDPGLAVAATATLPAQGEKTWLGSVTLTLALGDWQGSDKALADRSANLALQAVEAQRTGARSVEAQALLAVRSAADTVEARKVALTQALELQTETRLLFRAGKATDLDVEDAEVGAASARNDLFAAWADLYGARLDLEASRA